MDAINIHHYGFIGYDTQTFVFRLLKIANIDLENNILQRPLNSGSSFSNYGTLEILQLNASSINSITNTFNVNSNLLFTYKLTTSSS